MAREIVQHSAQRQSSTELRSPQPALAKPALTVHTWHLPRPERQVIAYRPRWG